MKHLTANKWAIVCLKNVTYKQFIYKSHIIYIKKKQDLALNNPQELLCHKTHPTNHRECDINNSGNCDTGDVVLVTDIHIISLDDKNILSIVPVINDVIYVEIGMSACLIFLVQWFYGLSTPLWVI